MARISPLTASVRYLSHLRRGLERHHPGHLTPGTSPSPSRPPFDPAALRLTAGPRGLGYPRSPCSGPQAALTAGSSRSAGQWRKGSDRSTGGTTSGRQYHRPVALIAVLGAKGNLDCTAWQWASTSCSAATTWTWRWPARSRAKLARAGRPARPTANARSPMPAAAPGRLALSGSDLDSIAAGGGAESRLRL